MSELLLLPDELFEELELEVLDDTEELVVLELVVVPLLLDESQAGIKKHSTNIKTITPTAILLAVSSLPDMFIHLALQLSLSIKNEEMLIAQSRKMHDWIK